MTAIFSVSQSCAVVAYLAELAAGTTVKSPPDTYFHAIVGCNHCFAHVVQLVGISHVVVFGHLCPEVGKGIEFSSQLVGVAPCRVWLYGIVPFGGIIVVEGVAGRDGYVLKAWIIFFELSCYFLEIGFCSLFQGV